MTEYELARALFSAVNELSIKLTGEPLTVPVTLNHGSRVPHHRR